jgi:tRNA-specific 2-thiouridylase
VKLPDFLKQKLKEKKGNVIKVSRDWDGFKNPLNFSQEYSFIEEDGIKIGEHNGAHFYTIGQRKGLNIGGQTNPFICNTDKHSNQHNICWGGR